MPTQHLTERFIQSLKPEPGTPRTDYFDGHTANLILRVSSHSKTFYYRYRSPNGGQPRLKLGPYPALKLADAREEALQLAGAVARGADPAYDRRKARDDTRSQTIRTLNDLSESYFAACESGGWAPKGKKKRRRVIDRERDIWGRYVSRTIGNLRLVDVTSKEVKKLLGGMVARGINAQTNLTQAVIRQAFNYAISTFDGDLVSSNPAHFRKMGLSKPKTRVLNDPEIRTFWRGCYLNRKEAGVAKGARWPDRPMQIVLQLCLLLMLRECEVVGMQVSELDLDQGLWLIPAERMKGNREHLVPLPPVAIGLIREAMRLRPGVDSIFVFPSPRRAVDKPMREDSVTHAMEGIVKALGIENASPHDLRRTASTFATSERVGVTPFIRSKLLAHSTPSGGGAAVSNIHYDRNEYVVEKRAALRVWADVLLGIVSDAPRKLDLAA
jgi:integrase